MNRPALIQFKLLISFLVVSLTMLFKKTVNVKRAKMVMSIDSAVNAFELNVKIFWKNKVFVMLNNKNNMAMEHIVFVFIKPFSKTA